MGGRIVMVEPEITPLSWLVYYFLHPEPVKLQVNPLAKNYLHEGRDPFAANQAIPHLLFTRYRNDFKRQFPSLAIRRYDRFSPFSYLLSGGFRHWSLLPLGLVSPLLTAERRLGGLLAPLLAFRLLAVIEKTAFHTSAAVE